MTVFIHSIAIICFKFLFVERLGPTATLNAENDDVINDVISLHPSKRIFKCSSEISWLLTLKFGVNGEIEVTDFGTQFCRIKGCNDAGCLSPANNFRKS